MIIVTCNEVFPKQSGFGIRMMREVKALSKIDQVCVIARQEENQPNEETIEIEGHPVAISRFSIRTPINEKPHGIPFFYEIFRNLQLILGFTKIFIKISRKFPKSKIYSISSPLTVPVLSWCIGIFTQSNPWTVSIHDLEPELAAHSKSYSNHHPVMLIEYFMEYLVARNYSKIIVTTQSQKQMITHRCKKTPNLIHVSPNTSEANTATPEKIKTSTKQLTVTYISSLTYPFTYQGLVELIQQWPRVLKKIPHAKLLIAGTGYSYELVAQYVQQSPDRENIKLLGHVSNVENLLGDSDPVIIPWKENPMTRTMLPTKYFTYISTGSVVIAPNFGEFASTINHGEDGFLFKTWDDFIQILSKIQENPTLQSTISSNAKKLFDKHYRSDIAQTNLVEFLTTK